MYFESNSCCFYLSNTSGMSVCMLYWLEVHALLTLRFYISAQFFPQSKLTYIYFLLFMKHFVLMVCVSPYVLVYDYLLHVFFNMFRFLYIHVI